MEKTLNVATAVVAEMRALDRKYMSNRPGNSNAHSSESPIKPAVTARPALRRAVPLTSYRSKTSGSSTSFVRFIAHTFTYVSTDERAIPMRATMSAPAMMGLLNSSVIIDEKMK